MSEDVARLIRHLSDSAFGLIRRIVRDRDEAMDLTQDVLVRILRRGPSDDSPQLKAYAMKAAYHAALNAVRDRNRHQRIHNRLREEQNCPASGAEEFEVAERKRLIEAALDRLPPKQRQAITYRFYGDLTIREIAATMEITEGSVKVHLFRGLENLNAQLAEKMKETHI